jgi:hypothetical protein
MPGNNWTLEQKKSNIDIWDPNSPVVGSVAVMNTNNVDKDPNSKYFGQVIGHVGFISSVNGDGTVTITESNYKRGQVGQRTGTPEELKIAGYMIDPAVTNGRTGDMEAQIRAFSARTGGTADERAQTSKDIMAEIQSGRATTPAQAKINLGIVTKEDQEVKDRLLADLKPLKSTYSDIERSSNNIINLSASDTAIGDVATIVSFLKTIDPSSVARESEVAGVESARGVIDGFLQQAEKLDRGSKLAPEQRQELQKAAKMLLGASQRGLFEKLITSKQELLGRGIEPTVVSDYDIRNLQNKIGSAKAIEIYKSNGIPLPPELEKVEQAMKNSVNTALSRVSNAVTNRQGQVLVQSPNGEKGYIPAEQAEEAKKEGYIILK